MDFLDDEQKKKKKKEKKNKPKKPSLQRKEYYEEIQARVNARLANLLRQLKMKEKRNTALATELVTIEDDRTDVCDHLDRQISQRQNTITTVQDTLITLRKEFNEYKKTSEKNIADLNKRYETDRSMLEKEIELQTKTLGGLDRDRMARSEALAKIYGKHDDIDQLNEQITNELFDMERKAVVQKNMLKEEVEVKIDSLVKDVVHSNEIRKASYIRSLMQENVSLRDRVDKLVLQTMRTGQLNERQMIKSSEIIESFVALEQLTKHLSRVIDNKQNIIRNLMVRIERTRLLYLETRRYHRFHQIANKRGLFQPKRQKSFQEINKYLNRLANEKKAIAENQRAQEQELEYMLSMLQRLRSKIVSCLSALMNLGPNEILDPVERRAAVEEMIFMTTFMSPRFPQCKSRPRPIYRRGSCGIVKAYESIYNEPYISQLDTYDEDSSNLVANGAKFDYQTELRYEPMSVAARLELNKVFDEIVLELDLPSDFVKTSNQFEKCKLYNAICDPRYSSSNSEEK